MDGVELLYASDSFFTLSMPGRVGLGLLSLALAAGLIFTLQRLGRGKRPLWRGATAAFFYWLFLWISPQIYYGYYMLILEGLSLQWVIGTPPGLDDMVRLLTFSERHDLSHHGRGLLGWVLIVLALWPQRVPARI